jgi:diaminohydroxyphosphoribosylaminopyrimidine deaminase/5-amino-6-(5-phosphoribosylamino)uracil reductase
MVGANTVLKDDPMLTCRLGDFADVSISQSRHLSDDKLEELLDQEIDTDQAEIDAEADGTGVTFRELAANNPIRIICDTHLRTPLDAKVVRTALEVPTYIATTVTDPKRQMPYREHDVELIVCPEADGHVDLEVLVEKLGALGIDSVIVEGGAELNWSVLSYDVVNKVQAYIAPKLFGGKDAPSPIKGFGVEAPDYAIKLSDPEVTTLGHDILVECEVL